MNEKLIQVINNTIEDNHNNKNVWSIYGDCKRTVINLQKLGLCGNDHQSYDEAIRYITEKLGI